MDLPYPESDLTHCFHSYSGVFCRLGVNDRFPEFY